MRKIFPLQQIRYGFGFIFIAMSVSILVWHLALPVMFINKKETTIANILLVKSPLYASMEPDPGVLDNIITRIITRFPHEMSVHETRHICVKVNRYRLSNTQQSDFSDSIPESCKDEHFYKRNSSSQHIKTPLQMKDIAKMKNLELQISINQIYSDVNVNLISSGFDIQGLSKAMSGDTFPLFFKWTITPRMKGTHDLLIDFSEIIDEARSNPNISYPGFDVWINELEFELSDELKLPIHINVEVGWLAWLTERWIIIMAACAVIGFILNHTLFISYFRKKYNL